MVARIIGFQPQPGKLDELLQIAAVSVIPIMQQQAGCKLITMLSDRSANKALAIGLWESTVDLQNNEQGGVFQEQLAKVKHLCAVPPTRELYEVCLQTTPI